MKEIDIENIENYTSFITRQGKVAKYIKHIPKADLKNRLLFLVDDKVLGCDQNGKCWTINGVDSSVLETKYYGFDIFVDSKITGWININNNDKQKSSNILMECSPVIYKTQEEALKNTTEKTFKTIKIEWSS